MKRLVLTVALFLIPSFLSAQVLSRVRTHSQLGTCSKDGAVVMINDALTAGTCAAGGSALAACWCDLSTTSWISQPTAPANLSSYVLLAGDADGQTIQGVTGVNQPRVFLDADTAELRGGGGAPPKVEVSETGARFLSADTTTTAGVTDGRFDVVSDVVAFDGNVSITGTIFVADSAGGVDGAESGINVYDTSLSATGVKWNAGTAGTGGNIVVTADDVDTAIFAAGSSTFTGLARLTPQATPPIACAVGVEGGLYVDSDTHLLCICNATGWVQVADGTTGCS